MRPIGKNALVDQYRLVRPIGQGSFGTVWLAYSEILRAYQAVKALNPTNPDAVATELEGVRKYKAMVGTIPGLMPIEHVGVIDNQVFYVMPLADGVNGDTPESDSWLPLTLRARIERQRSCSDWFSPSEIASWLSPICLAVQAISDAELAHRDIKPDNILFYRGQPVLSDVSLLRGDTAATSDLGGTPGYSAPSWYAESGGKLDMFSLAATLFTLLTGHSPDKLGRAAFRWPPQGESALEPNVRAAWLRFHQIILRATHAEATERYLTYAAMAADIKRAPDPNYSPGYETRETSSAYPTRGAAPNSGGGFNRHLRLFLITLATLLVIVVLVTAKGCISPNMPMKPV
jgi:serine/threonine protein kinase